MKRSIRRIFLALVILLNMMPACAAQEVFHAAYLHGFPDGSIRPEQTLTRAEFAAILCRMMQEPPAAEEEAELSFQDVPQQHWAYEAVKAVSSLGLMKGTPDGTFLPDRGLTGQELCVVLERLKQSDAAGRLLPELKEGWARQEITFAAQNGWVMGLHEGVFEVGHPLTRAEFAEIFNRILGRTPETLASLLVGMPVFADNADTKTPYFLAIQEAAIDHTARCDEAGEQWYALG